MSNLLLKVNNLGVEFGGEKVIESLSFEVKQGENFVILGPNGAGKTVLLKALLNLVPYEGEIRWANGVKLGYVPQRVPFVKDFPLTVEEFFQLKKLSQNEILEIMNLMGLQEILRKKSISILSSGQFQRVLIGWGIAGDCDVLLFDEPMAGIDIGGEETIYNLLDKIKKEKGLTIFLVTHDLDVVYHKADKVLCLNHQKLCYGSPQKVLKPGTLNELFGEKVKFFEHEY